MKPSVLLTFDVEDWFQVENLRALFPEPAWDFQPLRVEEATERILDALDAAGAERNGLKGVLRPIRATFFVLGWVARRCPGLVRRIHERGHEVASHGYGHRLCREQKPESLKADLRAGKAVLEDIVGVPVRGYRAPGFSIDERVLKLVGEAGYEYDSSYNSFSWNPRYGRLRLHGADRRGIAFRLPGGLAELPLSNLHGNGWVLPWAGGGYFRLMPSRCFHWGVRRILNRDGAFVFYLHPWEFDPGQPKVRQVSKLARFRHYVNLNETARRFHAFLRHFQCCDFLTCSEYLARAAAAFPERACGAGLEKV